ncbi:Ig-like domain-containing protein [Microbacterium sp. Mu-80]|uniref:Ig-like domain-containing protein n=1 Tax=Microbacterium bandirmense TaxID=3122050 RepID=A0ABU8LF54_9MICO
MSTDGTGEPPLTRAQLRAQRAAQAAQENPTVPDAGVPEAPVPGVPEQPEAPAAGIPAAEAPTAPPVPTPTTPVTTGIPAAAYETGADTPDVGRSPASGPTSGVSAPEVSPARRQTPEPRETPARDRRFALTLWSVLGVLALIVGILGVVSVTQGPRLSEVQVDPAQAIETSGSRIILTANQRLETIDAAQVTVEPAVPFTVDATGRSVGVRFTAPLDDSTTYQVTVAGVTAVGGGPSSDLATSFTTPASEIFLLQRAVDGDDKIFTTDLSGERATPVFTHPRIDDYRATGDQLVVAVEEDDGTRLLVMNRDGSDERELQLPGDGYVTSVQVSDRGGLVGYSYSDRELTETSGRASVLVTQPLRGEGEPRVVQIDGADASIAEWQFVPDSSSLLFIDFDGALSLEDPTGDAGVQSMGIAASILGVTRTTYTAIIERADASIVELNLTDGSEEPLTESDPDYGPPTSIETFPGGTLRHIVQRDDTGMPTGQAVVKVDDDGTATVITEVSGTDSILQVCASPSGQYAAVAIAPDLPTNDYDDLLLPLPSTLHTQLIDLRGDEEMPRLSGFDISWCRMAP